jgi:hypothetical protein
MSARKATQQLTVQELKQSILTLAALPRHQGRLDLSRKLDLLHRRDTAEFPDVIREGGLSRRAAFYLRKVGGLIRKAKLSTSQAESIGWTKLQIIADTVNAKNASRLLKLAEEHNAQELKRLIGEINPKSKPHCVLLYLTDWQYAQFETAVRRKGASRKGRGLIGKEEAIMRRSPLRRLQMSGVGRVAGHRASPPANAVGARASRH